VKRYVLDTSVAAAWYLPDLHQDAAKAWQRRLLSDEIRLLVPGLHYWEMANLLRTYCRRGDLDRSLAEDIFRIHLEAPLQIAEPEPAAVLATALDFEATAYDAVFIELARSLDAPLLTAERGSRPWVSRLGKLAVVLEA
jgi:predicted nucleic acid-binding protein